MIPLSTIRTRPLASWWGCALRSVTAPCVAHRVCPIPTDGVMVIVPALSPLVRCAPTPCVRLSAGSSESRFPTERLHSTASPSRHATPAESYPRYSNFRSPSSRTPVQDRFPTYPIIPHITCPQKG